MFEGLVNKMNYILASATGSRKSEALRGKRVGIMQIGSASYHAGPFFGFMALNCGLPPKDGIEPSRGYRPG